MLRTSNLRIGLNFFRSQGDLSLTVYSAAGGAPTAIFYSDGSSTPGSADTNPQVIDNEVAQLTGLEPGLYYIKVQAGPAHPNDTNNYSLSVDPLDPATHRVFYVNDQSGTDDYYALAPGDDANSGLSPYAPKASVQRVLAEYTLGPDDRVVIDTGTYGGDTVTIDQAHEGAVYAGSPGGTTFTAINGSDLWDLVGSQQNTIFGLTFDGNSRGIYAYASSSQDSSDNDIRGNTFLNNAYAAIEIDGGTNVVIRGNTVSGAGSYGIFMPSGGQATIGESAWPNDPADANTIAGMTVGIYVQGADQLPAEVSVAGNTVSRPLAAGRDPDPRFGRHLRPGRDARHRRQHRHGLRHGDHRQQHALCRVHHQRLGDRQRGRGEQHGDLLGPHRILIQRQRDEHGLDRREHDPRQPGRPDRARRARRVGLVESEPDP